MVRDPSIVSPSLTGVFIGGGHNKHGTGSRCTLPKQCRPPSPRRRWRCDRSSYKRSLFSRIRDSQMHYLTGPETTTRQHPVTVSDLCGVEPLRDGQAHHISFRISPAPAGDGERGVSGAGTDGEKSGQLIRWKQEASIPAVVRIHMSRWVKGLRAVGLRLTH